MWEARAAGSLEAVHGESKPPQPQETGAKADTVEAEELRQMLLHTFHPEELTVVLVVLESLSSK